MAAISSRGQTLCTKLVRMTVPPVSIVVSPMPRFTVRPTPSRKLCGPRFAMSTRRDAAWCGAKLTSASWQRGPDHAEADESATRARFRRHRSRATPCHPWVGHAVTDNAGSPQFRCRRHRTTHAALQFRCRRHRPTGRHRTTHAALQFRCRRHRPTGRHRTTHAGVGDTGPREDASPRLTPNGTLVQPVCDGGFADPCT